MRCFAIIACAIATLTAGGAHAAGCGVDGMSWSIGQSLALLTNEQKEYPRAFDSPYIVTPMSSDKLFYVEISKNANIARVLVKSKAKDHFSYKGDSAQGQLICASEIRLNLLAPATVSGCISIVRDSC